MSRSSRSSGEFDDLLREVLNALLMLQQLDFLFFPRSDITFFKTTFVHARCSLTSLHPSPLVISLVTTDLRSSLADLSDDRIAARLSLARHRY